MILVDTSVWVDHLARGDATMEQLLMDGLVLAHPFVIGEIAMGNLRDRQLALTSIRQLPAAEVAEFEDVLFLVERYGLFGLGVGYVDAHLLAAARLTSETALWTRDKRLHRAAARADVQAYDI